MDGDLKEMPVRGRGAHGWALAGSLLRSYSNNSTINALQQATVADLQVLY